MRISRGLLVLAIAAGCFGAKPVAAPKAPAPKVTSAEREAQVMLRGLSLRDRVAQLIMVSCYGNAPSRMSPEYKKFHHLVTDMHVGGFTCVSSVEFGMVQSAEPHAMAIFFNQMQKASKIPLLVASDFERAASFRVKGTTRFPTNMAFGAADDLAATRFEGLTAAREARAIGVNWLLAPVADVNNNPGNPVINVRSYGEDPDLVIRHLRAFIEGAHSDTTNRVLVTAKHFPGHGDTDINSHLSLPRLDVTRERMDAVELKPFRAAIDEGIDAVMTEHTLAPAIEPDEIPVTVSHRVVTDLLRNELKFPNLIVTDALVMEGLTKYFSPDEAAIRAILAGSDMLLMPPDPERAIRALTSAVLIGRIPKSRIDESAARVLTAKIRIGLMKKKLVDLDAISDVIESPEAADRAQEVSDKAVTLVRNQGNVIPLAKNSKPCLLVTREVQTSTIGQRMVQEFRRRAMNGRALTLDASQPIEALDASMKDLGECTANIIVSSMSPSDTRTSFALAGNFQPFIEKLSTSKTPLVLISLANPYLLAAFPKAPVYLATFSFTSPSELSAIKAIFGEIPIGGHMPVTIPGLSARGDGIQLPARAVR